VDANENALLDVLVEVPPTATKGRDDVGVEVVNDVGDMRYEKFELSEKLKLIVSWLAFIFSKLTAGGLVSSTKAELVAVAILFTN